MNNFPHLTEEFLQEEYHNKRKTTTQIAKEHGCTCQTIGDRMRRFGVKARNRSEALKGRKGHTYTEEEKKRKSVNQPKLYGARNPQWKGGVQRRKEGYIMIKAPHRESSNSKGYIMEHRLVMEDHLGRLLLSKEVVHHINEIRDDNRIENLQLFPNRGIHSAFHTKLNKLRKLKIARDTALMILKICVKQVCAGKLEPGSIKSNMLALAEHYKATKKTLLE